MVVKLLIVKFKGVGCVGRLVGLVEVLIKQANLGTLVSIWAGKSAILGQ